jgi:hypothetical protein
VKPICAVRSPPRSGKGDRNKKTCDQKANGKS